MSDQGPERLGETTDSISAPPAIDLRFLQTEADRQAEGLARTAPGHLRGNQGPGDSFALTPVMRYPLPPQVVIDDPKRDWYTVGKINKKLSQACLEHRFGERLPLRFRAFFKNQVVVGVAFGHGLNLWDPGQLAQRDKIYLFRQADVSGCTVAELPNNDPAVLQLPAR